MKILLCLTELVTGGAEIFVLRLAAGLQRRGHDVILLTLRGEASEPQLLRQFWPEGKAIHYRHWLLPLILKIDGLLLRLGLDQSLLRWFQIRYTRRLLDRLQPDLVHSHLYSSDVIVAQAIRSLSLPWVITIHGDYLAYAAACHETKTPFRYFPSRCHSIDQRVNQVVLISVPQRSALANMLPISQKQSRHQLIINGLPLNAAYSLTPVARARGRQKLGLHFDSFLIAMVARGIADKGWDVLIQAFQLANLPNSELLLIGDGPALSELARTSQSPQIHFHGPSSDPQSLLQLCDLSCLPSRYPSESCPLVVTESVANYVPVIATRIGQISWMIDEHTNHPAGRTLPLAPPDELRVSLASLLKEIHANPALLQAWKQNCGLVREKFSIERCAAAYLDVYRAAGA